MIYKDGVSKAEMLFQAALRLRITWKLPHHHVKICTLLDTFSLLKHDHLQPKPESDSKYINEMNDTILWNSLNIFTSFQSHQTTGAGIECGRHRGASNYRNTCKSIWNCKPYEAKRKNFLGIIPQNPCCHVRASTKCCMSRS